LPILRSSAVAANLLAAVSDGGTMAKTVYGKYDQAGLDAQFNLRARFPDHPQFMAAWAREGEAERKKPGWQLDLAYGPSPAEKLDLLLPTTAKERRAPLLVFIHGGYWQFLDKRDVDWMAPPFAAQGVAFAAINYALAPMVGLDEIVRQVRSALAWLWRNAPALGCDPHRIYVAGHSAGGHLTAMLAATDWAGLGGLPADLVKGAFPISGIYDLEPMRLCYHNAALKMDAATAARVTPQHMKPHTQKIWFTVGSKETDEFQRQQKELAAAWKRSGADVTVVEAAGLHHFDILEKFCDPKHKIGKAAFAMLGA
jgi:arylformamidase